MVSETRAPLVEVRQLLAEAGRRVGAVAVNDPVGSLAVIEVRVPHTTGTEQSDAVFEVVAGAAVEAGAMLAFDDDQGHFLLLLPMTRAWVAAEAVRALVDELSRMRVDCGRYRVRPSIGAGVVALAGTVSRADSVGLVDVALTEAIGLAQQSSVERGLRVPASEGEQHPVKARRWLPRRYFSLSPAGRAWSLALSNLVLAWLLPLVAFSVVYRLWRVDITGPLFWVVFAAVAITAATVYTEAVLALRPAQPPADEPSEYPPASAVVVAYLPNETDTILDTVRCLLAQDYPGSLEVVLAYNSPRPLPIEQELAQLAAVDPGLVLLRVGDSTSKAQNINAALQIVSGDFIGIFDSDHRPMPTSFRRAARWLAGGAEVVQGRSVVRNGHSNWLARMVAIEFEGIYAVAHPGRAALHTFGIFGGSNGFWRADVLDRLRMRPDMLTEDIDISIRAVFDGARIVVDPQLLSEELAPLTLMALWSQRIRWSQGWHQVSRRQLGQVWRAPALTARQRIGATFLLGWREAYPWAAALMVPILAFSLLVRHHLHIHWLLPLFAGAALYVSAVGPIQALFAWRLSVPELRRQRGWWWQYILVTGMPFGELKALANRAAHLRELIGDRAWQVTPRTTGQASSSVARRQAGGSDSALVTMGPVPGTVATYHLDLPLAQRWADQPTVLGTERAVSPASPTS